jgi:hypothetical protein
MVGEDGQVSPAAFSNLLVGVGGKGTPIIATRVATLRLPLEGVDMPVPARQTIRGSVQAELGARAALVAQPGGQTVVVPLPGPDANDESTVASTPRPGVVYQATFFPCWPNGTTTPKGRARS